MSPTAKCPKSPAKVPNVIVVAVCLRDLITKCQCTFLSDLYVLV